MGEEVAAGEVPHQSLVDGGVGEDEVFNRGGSVF
jgi:hypothetical protein